MSFSVLILLLIAPAFPDTSTNDSLPPPDFREYLDQLQDDAGGQDLLDALLWYHSHPFDLNLVSSSELLSIPFVTEAEADAVIRFRTSEGGLRSPAQLRTIPGIGEIIFRDLSPFVRVVQRDGSGGSKRIASFRSRLEERLPFDDGAIGNPVHAYSRISASPVPGIEAGGLFERDAGELSRDAFRSGYLWAPKLLPETDILIGDFSIEAGQGLVLWRGSGVSKSGWTVTGPRKAALGIIPHSSTDEIRFFRGVAASVQLTDGRDRLRGILFVSRRYLPGGLGDSGEISSISESSAFTTATSAARKDAVRVDSKGGRLLYARGETLNVGVTFVSSRFGIKLRRGDPLRFSGEKFEAAGLDFRISRYPFLLFGEWASGGNRSAFIAGTGIEVGSRFSALLVFRNYSAGYDNLYANGFGDNGDTRNELGAYAGIALQPLSWLSIHAYYDQFRHPGPGTLAKFPISGSEVMIDAIAAITPRVDVGARFTSKSTGVSLSMQDERGRELREEGIRSQIRWRLGTSVRFEKGYEFKTRSEFTRVSVRPRGDERGYLIAGEFRARPLRFFHVTSRLIFFATGSFESRLTSFESDLPGSFASTPLYGTGRRWVVSLSVDLSGWCSLSAIIDSTEKEPTVSTEPPNREVPLVRQSHAGLQLDLRL